MHIYSPILAKMTYVIFWCHNMKDYAKWRIWHQNKSIWLILVSQEASGPQHCHPLIWFWLKHYFQMLKSKSVGVKISLYIFWNTFVFLGLRAALLSQLGFWNFTWPFIYWKNEISLQANPYKCGGILDAPTVHNTSANSKIFKKSLVLCYFCYFLVLL